MQLPRARSLLDVIPNWRRVPMHVPILKASSDATGAMVGEGLAMPITELDLQRVTLMPKKAAAAIVVTDELLRAADSTAEVALAGDLGCALAEALDRAAFDPDVTDSITNAATTIPSTGNSLAQIDADLASLLDVFEQGNAALDSAVFVLSARTASYLATLRGSGGALAFPTVTVRGGTLAGLPVYISSALTTDDSQVSSIIALLDPTQVFVSDNEEMQVTSSISASMQMIDPTPDSVVPTPTDVVSLFQVNATAIGAVRWAA